MSGTDDSTAGISRAGRDAEQRYCDATGAVPATKASAGDAVLEGHLVEVKGVTATTLNQVRAVKYLPLVVFLEWYVVPAHVVVALVSRKQRGQHTENPFESATLSTKDIVSHRVADVSQLAGATLDAVSAAEKYPEIGEAMRAILAAARYGADEALRRVRVLLAELGLDA